MRWSAAGLCAALLVSASARAHPPFGLVIDRAGSVYFSDLEAVWQLAPDGSLEVVRSPVDGHHVHELAVAADGGIDGDQNAYDPVTERFLAGVWHRAPDGRLRDVASLSDRPPRGLGVWQDHAGNRYTAQWLSNDDRRTVLRRRAPDGTITVLYAEGGARPSVPQSAGSVGGMAFPADGSVVFADGRALRRVAKDGRVSVLYETPAVGELRGIAVGRGGMILAADAGRRAVLELDGGRDRIVFRETADWLPTAVAAAHGRLLVLEANADPHELRDRVRLVGVRDGRAQVIAEPAAGPLAPRRAARARTSPWWPVGVVTALLVALAGWALRRRVHARTPTR